MAGWKMGLSKVEDTEDKLACPSSPDLPRRTQRKSFLPASPLSLRMRIGNIKKGSGDEAIIVAWSVRAVWRLLIHGLPYGGVCL